MENKQNLMKHFASVLRGRAIGTQKAPSIQKNTAKYFSRKELVEIIKRRFDGTIPKEHNLVEMENTELLGLIGDEMFIISYVTEKWSREQLQEVTPVNEGVLDKMDSVISKAVAHESKKSPSVKDSKNESQKKKNDMVPK